MRSRPTLFFCVMALFLSESLVASPSVDVKLNYKYSGEPKVPPKSAKYCLDIAQSDELSVRAIEKLHKACGLAAGLKGYHLVGKEADCHKLNVELDVEDDDSKYLKTARFAFFENGPDKASLNVTASFQSETKEFNSYSMIATCRAIFNEIPPESKNFHVDASTEPDDTGRRADDDSDHPPVNGNGMYLMSELMFNGLGGSAGYYFSDEVGLEAGFLELSHSLNMDVNRLTKYYVKSRLFFTRRAYVGLGVAWQNAEFTDRYQYYPGSDQVKVLPTYADPSGDEFKGSLQTFGGEVSIGYLFGGASHKKGLMIGADWIGTYSPMMVTEDKIRVASGDSSMHDKIVHRIKSQQTYYLLRLIVGYNF